MGVYIKGFIPTDGLYQIKDGVIRKYKEKGGTVRPYELVEVKEPHGNSNTGSDWLVANQRKHKDSSLQEDAE